MNRRHQIIVSLLSIGVLLSALFIHYFEALSPSNNHESQLIDTIEVDTKDLSDLEILSYVSKVKIIETSNTDTITVRQYSNKDKKLITYNNGTLKLGEIKMFNFDITALFNKDEVEYFEIELPSDILESLSIKISSGRLDFETLTVKNLNIRLGSGVVNGSDVRSEHTNIKITSGSLNIDTLDGSGDIEISSGFSKFNSIHGDYNVKVTSGKLNMNAFEGSLHGKLTSGSITMDNTTLLKDSDFKVSSGSLKISLSDTDSNYCYETSKSSGRLNYPNNTCSNNSESINVSLSVTSGIIDVR